MAEYIVGTDEHEGHWYTGERIVRCRDCQYYMENCEYFDNEPACLRCGSELDGYDAFTTDPDGYCAWGVPKEG